MCTVAKIKQSKLFMFYFFAKLKTFKYQNILISLHKNIYKIDQLMSNNNDEKKVQVGKDQEKTQSEKDSHSKNRGGKKPK